MSENRKAIVIGAGIGGLTAALALLHKGIDVEVYERANELTEVGAGVHVSPNGSRVLAELGLSDDMAKFFVMPKARDVRLWCTGQVWQLRNHDAGAVARYKAPYLLAHRGDLHAMLVNAVRRMKPDAIHVNAECIDVCQEGDVAVALFHQGKSARGDFVVAADGVRSRVRQTLFGADSPTFTGVVAWRGLVPIDRVPRISPYTATNWIGPDGSITLYGVRSGQLLNFVGLKTTDTWQAESWTEVGDKEDLLSDFEGWHDDVLEIIQQIETPYKWGLFLHEPLERWSKGRITLLGDASHATLPFLGQGANMAIEDGMVLSRCIAMEADTEAALRRYEAARASRTAKIVRRSAEQGERVRSRDLRDAEGAARFMEQEWSPNSVAQWYDWIFEYNAVDTAL